MIDPETGEILVDEGPEPFSAVIRQHAAGHTLDQLDADLAELVQLVDLHQTKATLTVTVEVAPTGAPGTLTVTVSHKKAPPKLKAMRGIFYADASGNLLRSDPNQPELPLPERNER